MNAEDYEMFKKRIEDRIKWENRNAFSTFYWKVRNRLFGHVIAKDPSMLAYIVQTSVKCRSQKLAENVLKSNPLLDRLKKH